MNRLTPSFFSFAIPVFLLVMPSQGANASDSGRASTSCDGLSDIRSPNAVIKDGSITQNLTDPGFVLEGVPPPFQGYRDPKTFGSCTMATAVTAMTGYANSRQLKVEPLGHPFFKLGQVVPPDSHGFGGWDKAVNSNFDRCRKESQSSLGADSAMKCLSQMLGKQKCEESTPIHVVEYLNDRSWETTRPPCIPNSAVPNSGTPPPNVAPMSCPTPALVAHGNEAMGMDNAQGKRDFVRDYFGNSDRKKILPLGMPWDFHAATWKSWPIPLGHASFVHASTLIGRRLEKGKRCQLLVRNSWAFCANRIPGHYAKDVTCDAPGKTEDIWLDEVKLLKVMGALYEYKDST